MIYSIYSLLLKQKVQLAYLDKLEHTSRTKYTAIEEGMSLEDAAGSRRMNTSDVGLLKLLVSHLAFTMLSLSR